MFELIAGGIAFLFAVLFVFLFYDRAVNKCPFLFGSIGTKKFKIIMLRPSGNKVEMDTEIYEGWYKDEKLFLPKLHKTFEPIDLSTLKHKFVFLYRLDENSVAPILPTHIPAIYFEEFKEKFPEKVAELEKCSDMNKAVKEMGLIAFLFYEFRKYYELLSLHKEKMKILLQRKNTAIPESLMEKLSAQAPVLFGTMGVIMILISAFFFIAGTVKEASKNLNVPFEKLAQCYAEKEQLLKQVGVQNITKTNTTKRVHTITKIINTVSQ